MMPKNDLDKIYISSAKKLRASFPKFVLFISLAYSVWLIGLKVILPLSKGSSIGLIEVTRIDSLLILGAVLALIFASFVEMKNLADACAGLMVSYISHQGEIEELRLRKVRRTFRITGYLIPTVISYLIFASILEQIHPMLTTIIPILIVVWVVIASVLLAMILGLELEEAAKSFAEKIEERIKKKKK